MNFKKGFVLWTGVLLPLIPLQLYLAGNWYSFFSDWTLAMVLGLVSYTYFLIVLVLSARIRFLDRLFGHDRVMLFHAIMAILGLVFAFIHHLLKERYLTDADLQSRLGSGAILVFGIVMGLTLLFMVPNILHRIRLLDRLRLFVNTRLKLDYVFFKVLHNLTAGAVILLSVHVILASSTQENNVRLLFMIVTFSLALIMYIYHKFLRPLINKAGELEVQSVARLNEQTIQINMTRLDQSQLSYKAGQFGFFRFYAPGISSEEHPFTFSSSPEQAEISLTVKDLGDYSHSLQALHAGARVLLDGPYGRFTPEPDGPARLFIAGGIGITPFLSLLGHFRQQDTVSPLTLVWACREKQDLVYHQLFQEWERDLDWFTYIPILSDQGSDWKGESGFVTREWLDLTLAPARDSEAYICGPPIMMRLVSRALRDMGIKKVYSEKFSL